MSSAPKRFRVLFGLPLLAVGLGALVAACDAAEGPTELDASPTAAAARRSTLTALQGTFTVAEVARTKEVREKMQPRLQLQPTLGLELSGDLESVILRAHGHGDAEGESAAGTLRPVEARFREEAVSRYELRAVEGTLSEGVLRAEAAARLGGTPSQPATFKVKEMAPRQR